MKFVSVIGDSISTFEGYNPQGYSVFYDKEMQIKNGLNSVYDTWWAKVNQAMSAYLCVNNSYSGSRVTGMGFPAASSEERLNHLRTEEYSPDIILIYVGYNDFGNGIKVRQYKKGLFPKKDLEIFEDAYDIMLNRIIKNNPDAIIVCGTLMRSKLAGNEYWKFPEFYAGTGFEVYNDAIRKTVRKNNCFLADVDACDMRYETLDGSHPTAKGHLTIASAWIRCLSDLNLIKG